MLRQQSMNEYIGYYLVDTISRMEHDSTPKTFQWIGLVWFVVFNATFNNISAISWQSVLLVEETGENHRPVASH
jgi:hypothetical protein